MTKNRGICLVLCGSLLWGISFYPGHALGAVLTDAEKYTIAFEAAELFRAARAIIAKNQKLINDPGKGDKGLTADIVIREAKEVFRKTAGKELPKPNQSTLDGQVRIAMLLAIRTVVDEAQPSINESGKGFKGFLPAVFAARVAGRFSRNMEGKAFIKLTAPMRYLRNRANRPDKWEHRVIESFFKDPDYPRDKAFAENFKHRGKQAYRLILPEYYKEPCLACHGGPRGEKDITGGRKEGGRLGELGGAISFAIYD
ncbi:MAG: DUF3365 domain-containing protein [Nitrospinae bacterium]|nr:DUF3365 domain-containing protein [Nitrospinota bacterium]